MIITISGSPGSGKSSIGKALAKKMRYKFYSAGDVRGKIASEKGLTIDELNKLAEKEPSSDKFVDEYLTKLGETEDNIVVDARLGFYFIPKSVKVYVDASLEIRAQRIFQDKRSDEKYSKLSDAKRKIELRQKSDITRYTKLYSINPYESSHYDLTLDSSESTVDELAGQIYRYAMFKANPAKRVQ